MNKRPDGTVLVTGGASFIGSHLVDALVARGDSVRVVDNLTSGRFANIATHVQAGRVEFIDRDLLEPSAAAEAVRGVRLVFHLAACHGGRGYVDLHQADCASNLQLDGLLFRASLAAGVDKIVFASSGCVYPNFLQTDPSETLYLSEEMAGPPYDADNMYGWAKLMGEMTLRSYHRDYGLKSACCRYFTVYGPRGHENHAIIGLIAKAFVRQDPFEIWGDGSQIRNWTHVSDIVAGTLLAAERLDDGRPINLGSMERISVRDAAVSVLRYFDHDPGLVFRVDRPTGPLNRVADNTLAAQLLDWRPSVRFADGLRSTIDWYVTSRTRDIVAKDLDRALTERAPLGA